MMFIIIYIINALYGLKNATFFIGESKGTPFEIQAFPDTMFNSTVISANDFLCSEGRGCKIVSDERVFYYLGKEVIYKEALV